MGLSQYWELTSKVLGIDQQMLGMYPNVRHLPMRSNQIIRMIGFKGIFTIKCEDLTYIGIEDL